jgi:hypothetical protein
MKISFNVCIYTWAWYIVNIANSDSKKLKQSVRWNGPTLTSGCLTTSQTSTAISCLPIMLLAQVDPGLLNPRETYVVRGSLSARSFVTKLTWRWKEDARSYKRSYPSRRLFFFFPSIILPKTNKKLHSLSYGCDDGKMVGLGFFHDIMFLPSSILVRLGNWWILLSILETLLLWRNIEALAYVFGSRSYLHVSNYAITSVYKKTQHLKSFVIKP